jgi:hypothetical protein
MDPKIFRNMKEIEELAKSAKGAEEDLRLSRVKFTAADVIQDMSIPRRIGRTAADMLGDMASARLNRRTAADMIEAMPIRKMMEDRSIAKLIGDMSARRSIEDNALAKLGLVDSLKDVIAEREKLAGTYRESVSAQELLRELTETRNAFVNTQELIAISETLNAAIQPMLGFQSLLRELDIGFLSDPLGNLNRAIAEASFIAEFDLASEDEASPDEGTPAERTEAQLIKIVPAEVLDKLRRVEFEPVLLLDRFVRDPEAMRSLSPREFEAFVARLAEELGFENVVLTPASGDGGRDILAIKRVHGISFLCAFECKRYSADRPVGPEIARALLGTITHEKSRATKGILVTTSSFTPAAREFILTEPNLDGKDFAGIVGWLQEYASLKK